MIFRIMFWLMLPVSALQGLRLRKKATRLPGAPGARTGSTGAGNTLQLLAIGDSIIDGVGTAHIGDSLPVQFAKALAEETGNCVHWRVEGETGFDIDDVLGRLQSLDDASQPDFVLISVGVNDVTGLSSTRHWRKKLVELMDRLQQQWPGANIIFAGLPPMSQFPLPPQPLRFTLGIRAATLDQIAAGIIDGYPKAIHVPTLINPRQHGFCDDGFHPSAESCTLWAKELALIESRRESV
jgi:lysophospholipase L1-like esterase